jgi:hypothetical protein
VPGDRDRCHRDEDVTKSLVAIGLKPVLLVVLETLFLAALVMAAIKFA